MLALYGIYCRYVLPIICGPIVLLSIAYLNIRADSFLHPMHQIAYDIIVLEASYMLETVLKIFIVFHSIYAGPEYTVRAALLVQVKEV